MSREQLLQEGVAGLERAAEHPLVDRQVVRGGFGGAADGLARGEQLRGQDADERFQVGQRDARPAYDRGGERGAAPMRLFQGEQRAGDGVDTPADPFGIAGGYTGPLAEQRLAAPR